ncbi:MAG: adenosylcobinamide-phosphate synthase CbiB [Anaerobutyricum sp.]|nr:adenosylcobinamide-phosphate synthase CbiB [Eubacterium sp.]MDY6045465.1 adenosylcobinamide-phosphate synthase CbiB [Anaerobutyricum sp.]
MKLICAMILGFVIDLIIGDPHGIIHPVQIIGWFIDKIKKGMQHMIYGCSWKEVKERQLERKETAELLCGYVLTFIIVVGTFVVITAILYIAGWIHPWLRFALETFFIYQILATKSLKKESMKVYYKLKEGDLSGARKEISYLVGRDTQELDESEIAKADVETIAENTADGIIAPMFFIALGGAPLGFAYKAVNTLDSMVAYRNDELIHIGHASAKLDDICNFIPARLAAFMMIVAAAILRMDVKGAIKIFKRDRFAHLSPNSAQTEAVAAGALNIQLGGTHNYFGKPVEKPTIGDDIRPVEYEDIKRTNQLLYVSAFLTLVVCCGITFVLVYFLGNPLELL